MRRNQVDRPHRVTSIVARVRSIVVAASVVLSIAAAPEIGVEDRDDRHLHLLRTVAGLLQTAGRLLELSATLAAQLAQIPRPSCSCSTTIRRRTARGSSMREKP